MLVNEIFPSCSPKFSPSGLKPKPDSPTARRLEPALDGVARVRQRRKQAIQLFFEGDRVPLGLGQQNHRKLKELKGPKTLTKDVTNWFPIT